MKTLKDLAEEDDTTGTTEILTHELREAAKEWIDKLREELKNEYHAEPTGCENNGACGDAGFCVSPNGPIIGWIKNFFNLDTEVVRK